MTDTNTLAPADAEILDAAEDFRSQYTHGGTTFDEFDALDFARAVLAKWGQPAPASQPVAVPAQAGEPWYGHKFKEQHRGIWRCECGKTVKETTADWLDMSADELRNLRTETAALCADYDAARAVLAKWGTPQPTQAIEDAAIAYAEARHTQGSDLYNGTTYSARQVLKSAIRAGVGAAPATPENIREGAPYDCPAFEAMAREFHVWGRASGALCAQFWLGGMRAAAPKP